MCSFAQIEEKLTASENFMSCHGALTHQLEWYKVAAVRGDARIEILDGTPPAGTQTGIKCTLLAALHNTSSATCGRSLH